MLTVNLASTHCRAIQALREVLLAVAEGELFWRIGSNGAGKSTLLKTVSGLLRPRTGTISLNGARIHGLTPAAIGARGVRLGPAGRQIFPGLRMEANLSLGAFGRRGRESKRGLPAGPFSIHELSPRPGERRKQHAGTLPGGEQLMLAIGRGWLAKPSVRMLDEPSHRLAPTLVEVISEILPELGRGGVTPLRVGQSAALGQELVDRGFVLQTGRLVKEGSGRDPFADDSVGNAHLAACEGLARRAPEVRS